MYRGSGPRARIKSMISVDVCQGNQTTGGLPPDQIGALLRPPASADGANGAAAAPHVKKKQRPLLWVDVSDPTEDDWNTLAREFGFHPLAIEDARKQDQRAKMDTYPGYLFLTLRAWANSNGQTDDLTDATREIDVFLGPNYIVTIHEDDSPIVQETRRRLKEHPERIKHQPAFLLYLLLDAIVDAYFPVMDALDAKIDDMEIAIYAPGAVIDLAPAIVLKKRLLLLRQGMTPLRDLLNQLLRSDETGLVNADLHPYYQDVFDHALRLVEQVDLHRDILSGVLDAMNAQINNRLNQVMKTLTAISTILMSAALISGIYGMNFDFMPELKWRYGYFGALGLMVVVAGGLAVYFRRIRWL